MMDTEDERILSELTEIFRDILDAPTLVIGPETTAEDVEGWDSVTHVNILVSAEVRFGVRFEVAEIELLKNVGELVRLIRRQIDAKR